MLVRRKALAVLLLHQCLLLDTSVHQQPKTKEENVVVLENHTAKKLNFDLFRCCFFPAAWRFNVCVCRRRQLAKKIVPKLRTDCVAAAAAECNLVVIAKIPSENPFRNTVTRECDKVPVQFHFGGFPGRAEERRRRSFWWQLGGCPRGVRVLFGGV